MIQNCMAQPGLEFVWVGDDAIDPLEQAQTLNILVAACIKTREEARADLGLPARGREGAGACPHRSLCVRRCATPCKRKAKRFRSLEQKENISLTAYAGRGIVIYSGRNGGGDEALPCPSLTFQKFLRCTPGHWA
jgi:hypothetical protein